MTDCEKAKIRVFWFSDKADFYLISTVNNQKNYVLVDSKPEVFVETIRDSPKTNVWTTIRSSGEGLNLFKVMSMVIYI